MGLSSSLQHGCLESRSCCTIVLYIKIQDLFIILALSVHSKRPEITSVSIQGSAIEYRDSPTKSLTFP
ncbi:hypothetical protein WG66_013573 [Moniliophthora roreri]|nr:hypothetical protein WG66_013573 [Moniliophthora roreri]